MFFFEKNLTLRMIFAKTLLESYITWDFLPTSRWDMVRLKNGIKLVLAVCWATNDWPINFKRFMCCLCEFQLYSGESRSQLGKSSLRNGVIAFLVWFCSFGCFVICFCNKHLHLNFIARFIVYLLSFSYKFVLWQICYSWTSLRCF